MALALESCLTWYWFTLLIQTQTTCSFDSACIWEVLMLTCSCLKVLCWSCRHWGVWILLVCGKWWMLEIWWGLHWIVNLVRGLSLRESLWWNWVESGICLESWVLYQILDWILEIGRDKWFEISFRIFLFVLFFRKLLHRLFLLNFFIRNFLYLLIIFFLLLFSMEKIKFLVSFLLFRLLSFYFNIKFIFSSSSLSNFRLLFKIFDSFVWFLLSFDGILWSDCSLILLKIRMLKYLWYLRPVFRINSEYFLDNINFHRIYIT